MRYFIYNGEFYKEGSPVTGPDNRGTRYGDGLFETMKSSHGQLILAEAHFSRLWNGMKLLGFEIPAHFTAERLKKEIADLQKKNGDTLLTKIRLTIFRGDGGLFDEINNRPHYLVQTWPLPANTGKWISNGLTLGIYTDARKSCDMLSNLKHNNFLPYVMASFYAKKQQWNDAVVLNTAGRVSDSTIANIFLVKNKAIYTPSLEEGCIAGVMRKHILDFLHTHDWKPAESAITVDDLLAADEVFLTNAVHNIRWVQAIGHKKYANTVTRKIYSSVLSTISC